MQFSHLVQFFERLENTASGNEMIETISELFQEAAKEEIDTISYFILGQITADYQSIQMGLGIELVKSAIHKGTKVPLDTIEKMMKEHGDLGTVLQEIIGDQKKDNAERRKPLEVVEVHKTLLQIAKTSGSGSVQIKIDLLSDLIERAHSKEGKYLIRLVTGTMRLGAGTMTVLDGLAKAFLGSKSKRPELEHAYNLCSDIGYVAKTVAKNGIKGIHRIEIAINRPIRPMLAQRVDKMSEIKEKMPSEIIAAEEKYDGERIQAHIDGDQVRLFSRRLSDVTDQFPDVVEHVLEAFKGESAVLDGEVVAYDYKKNVYRPFQQLMKRRRKYQISEFIEKIPVKYQIFDLLYMNGHSFLGKNYPERRSKLEKTVNETKFIGLAVRITSTDLDEIDEFFQDCVDRGLEGIICKSCTSDSYYRAGARAWSWIKWKPEYGSDLSDTIDLVVVGAYSGRGKRGGTYGAILCAAYNHEEDIFQTLCKLGSGFTDKELADLPKKLVDARSKNKPTRVQVSDQIKPDYWFIPKYVLEVKGSEISESPIHTANWNAEKKRGLSLRFPRFQRWRPEKSQDQVTTVEEIIQMSK
ncbi:MAG: ATP-dependent DNA ligase [Promethearchaeota archaeon]